MMLSRRTLLGLFAAAGLSPGWLGRRSPAQTDVAKPFFLIFDDIGPGLPPDALGAAISPFAERGIPIGFVLRADKAATAGAWEPLVTAIGRFAALSPGLAEIIAWAPEIADEPPYFQIRAGARARKQAEAILGPARAIMADLPPVLSLAGWERPGSPPVGAARAAGFRNVILLPEKPGAFPARRSFDRVASLRGGRRHSLAEPAAAIRTGIGAAGASEDAVVLSLSLEGIADPGQVAGQAQALAEAVLDVIRTDRIFAALPREHMLWFRDGFERLVGLRIETPPDGDALGAEALEAFTRLLDEGDLSFSLSPPGRAGGGAAYTPCSIGSQGPAPDCIVVGGLPDDDAGIRPDAVPEIVIHRAGAHRAEAMDADGVFHITEALSLTDAAVAGRDLSAMNALEDVVLSIGPAAYATAAAREAVLNALTGAADETRSAILSVPDYAARVLPADPAYRLMLATRRDAAAAAPARGGLTRAERRAFLDDARIAWSYVDRLTEKATGLCPSTASFDGEWSSYYRFLTMWDIASLIEATLSAHEIGLISDADFQSRIGAILDGVPAERVGGLVLPSEEIRTDMRQVSRAGFNACDTGRLLSVLKEVDLYPLSRGMGATVFAGWTIAGAVRDGQLQSFTPRGFRPPVLSHCGHYTARALASWGIPAVSPYDVMQGESPTDARMRLLYQVGHIGAMGAEPMLLEAVEMGLSPASAYLADVLFTAQARSFAADGHLVCVSETPMNRAPWFSAQGLSVNEGTAGAWDIQSAEPGAEFMTPEFEASAMVISTKAAFLWAAVRPDAYSARLLDHVRARARGSEAGYAAGIYSATDTPMTNYTDINTNGIILQAIAYALRGRRARNEG